MDISNKIIEIIKLKPDIYREDIETFTNQIIDKTNQSLEKFRYNVLIALYYEAYSFFKKVSEKNKNFKNLKENYKKILLLMTPVIPHITNECISQLDDNRSLKWPEVNEKYLVKSVILIIIQVNGKKRGSITVKENIGEKELITLIKEKFIISKYLDNKELLKTIYIKGKIINFIIK